VSKPSWQHVGLLPISTHHRVLVTDKSCPKTVNQHVTSNGHVVGSFPFKAATDMFLCCLITLSEPTHTGLTFSNNTFCFFFRADETVDNLCDPKCGEIIVSLGSTLSAHSVGFHEFTILGTRDPKCLCEIADSQWIVSVTPCRL